jgi:predicted glycoside hydrolase/deacetylase ChbG (UPF0249 family)
MRAYAGLTYDEVRSLFSSQALEIETLFAATPEFISTHSELDEEEREFILSMLAAEESIELREEGFGFVLAAEIPTDLIDEQGADSITISSAVSRDWAACIFLVSPDGEELTWFAIQEVEEHLPTWGS